MPDKEIAIVADILTSVNLKNRLLEDLRARCQAEVSYKLSEVYLQSRFLLLLTRFNELSWAFFHDPFNVTNFDNLSKCEMELTQIINSLTSPSDHL